MPTIQQFKQQEDRKRQAYQHFINKGYSPEASAGIMGLHNSRINIIFVDKK